MSLFVYIIIYIPFVRLSLPGQLGTNPFVSATPAVPHSTSLLRGAAGGLSADTPFEVTLTESPGKVLPMTQEDVSPPPFLICVCMFMYLGCYFTLGSLPCLLVARYELVSLLYNWRFPYSDAFPQLGALCMP